MSYDNWVAAFRPKTQGTWNLFKIMTEHIQQAPQWILLSSSAGVIGNRGQANYAAANVFQDAFARAISQAGVDAVSIDLGPILGAGMLHDDQDVLNILKASGFYGIRHQDFLTVVKHVLAGKLPGDRVTRSQVVMGVGTGGLIRQNQPADPYWSRKAIYTIMNEVDMPPAGTETGADVAERDVRQLLLACEDLDSATEVICSGLLQMLAKSMNMLPDELDRCKSPSAYGVDSLVAIGVRGWVYNMLSVTISVFEVLGDSTIAELSEVIATQWLEGRDK
jgi:KR domain